MLGVQRRCAHVNLHARLEFRLTVISGSFCKPSEAHVEPPSLLSSNRSESPRQPAQQSPALRQHNSQF